MIKFIDEDGIIAPSRDLPLELFKSAEVALTTFSTHLFEELLRATGAVPCCVVKGGVDKQLYLADLDGVSTVVYLSNVGAPAAVATMEEVLPYGIKHVVAFGICGALVHTPPHTFIVPDKAYRDEGTSYHYMPASDFINIKNAAIVQSSLSRSGIDTMVGGTWTTDGFYRETRTRLEEMKKNGCIAVDMECSALQACADYRGKNFYTFFITADSLAGEQWQPNDILDLKVTDSTTVAVAAAIRLARELKGK